MELPELEMLNVVEIFLWLVLSGYLLFCVGLFVFPAIKNKLGKLKLRRNSKPKAREK